MEFAFGAADVNLRGGEQHPSLRRRHDDIGAPVGRVRFARTRPRF